MKGWRAGSVALPIIVVAVHAAFALLMRPAFAKMYEEFGVTLPLATELALHPVTMPLIATFVGAGAVLAITQERDRVVLLAVVIAAALLLLVALTWALYLPGTPVFFHRGGTIK